MNIYAGNLSFDETDESLEAAFANHGEVQSARVVTDRDSGRSRGSASSRCRSNKRPRRPSQP